MRERPQFITRSPASLFFCSIVRADRPGVRRREITGAD
jgi:hypothetical protein